MEKSKVLDILNEYLADYYSKAIDCNNDSKTKIPLPYAYAIVYDILDDIRYRIEAEE